MPLYVWCNNLDVLTLENLGSSKGCIHPVFVVHANIFKIVEVSLLLYSNLCDRGNWYEIKQDPGGRH